MDPISLALILIPMLITTIVTAATDPFYKRKVKALKDQISKDRNLLEGIGRAIMNGQSNTLANILNTAAGGSYFDASIIENDFFNKKAPQIEQAIANNISRNEAKLDNLQGYDPSSKGGPIDSLGNAIDFGTQDATPSVGITIDDVKKYYQQEVIDKIPNRGGIKIDNLNVVKPYSKSNGDKPNLIQKESIRKLG